jgi:hypothetical protein
MLRPWAHTDPTKLPFTFLARHMAILSACPRIAGGQSLLATTGLFNSRATFFTFLRIGIQPIRRL